MTTRLREWREGHGYSLQDAADLTGLSVSALSRIERGQRNARPATKVRIARRLGATVAELFPPQAADRD